MTYQGKSCQSCLQNGQNHCLLSNTQGICCDKGDPQCSQTALNYGSNLYCASNVNYDLQTSIYTCPSAARCPQASSNLLLSQISQVNGFSDSWSWFQYIQNSVCKYRIYTQVPQTNIILSLSQISGGATIIVLIMNVNTFEFPIQSYQITSSSQQNSFNVSGTYYQYYIYILPDAFSSGSYRISAYIESAWQPQLFVFDNSVTNNASSSQKQQNNQSQINNNATNQQTLTSQIQSSQSQISNQQVNNQSITQTQVQQNNSTNSQSDQSQNQTQNQQVNQQNNQSLILNPQNQSSSSQSDQWDFSSLIQDKNSFILIVVISVIVCVLIIFFSILICCLSRSKEVFKDQLELNQKIIFHQQKDIRQVLNEIEYLHNNNLKEISKHNNENENYQTTEPAISTMAGNSNLNASYSVKQSNGISQNWRSSITKNTNLSPQNFTSNSKLINYRNLTHSKVKEFNASSNTKINKIIQKNDASKFGFPFSKSIIENIQSPKFKDYQSSRKNKEIYKTQDMKHNVGKVSLTQIQEESEVYKRKNISRDFMNNSTGKFINLKHVLDQSSDSFYENEEQKTQKMILEESNEICQEMEFENPKQKNMNYLQVSKYNNALKSQIQDTSSIQDPQNYYLQSYNSNIFQIQKIQNVETSQVENILETNQNQMIFDLRKKKNTNDIILKLPSKKHFIINAEDYMNAKKQQSNISEDFAKFFRNFSFMKNQDFQIEKISINSAEQQNSSENVKEQEEIKKIDDFLSVKRQLTKVNLNENIKAIQNQRKSISEDSLPQSLDSSKFQIIFKNEKDGSEFIEIQNPPSYKEQQSIQPINKTYLTSSLKTTKQINPMSQVSSQDPQYNDYSEKVTPSRPKQLNKNQNKFLINLNHAESRYDKRPFKLENRKSQILNTIDNLVFSSENNEQESFQDSNQIQNIDNKNLTLDIKDTRKKELLDLPDSNNLIRRDSRMFEIYKKQKSKMFDLQQSNRFSRKLEIENYKIKPVEVSTTTINQSTIPRSNNIKASNSSWLYNKHPSPQIDDNSSQDQHSDYIQNHNIQQMQNAKMQNNIQNDKIFEVKNVFDQDDIEKNKKSGQDSLNYQSIQNIEFTINDCQLQQHENSEYSKTPNFKINNYNSNISNEKINQIQISQQQIKVQNDIQSQLNFDYDLVQQEIQQIKIKEKSPTKQMKNLFNKFLNIFKKENKQIEEKTVIEEPKQMIKEESKIVELSQIDEMSQEIEEMEHSQNAQIIQNMNARAQIMKVTIEDVDQHSVQAINEPQQIDNSINFQDLTIVNNVNDTSIIELIDRALPQVLPYLNKSHEIMNLSQDHCLNRENIQENQQSYRLNHSNQRNKSVNEQVFSKTGFKNEWLHANQEGRVQQDNFIINQYLKKNQNSISQSIIQQNFLQESKEGPDNQNDVQNQNLVTPRSDNTVVISPDNKQTNQKLIHILHQIQNQDKQIETNQRGVIKLQNQNNMFIPKECTSQSEIQIILSSQQLDSDQNQDYNLDFDFKSSTLKSLPALGTRSISKKVNPQNYFVEDQQIQEVNKNNLQSKYKQNKMQLQFKKEIINLETPNSDTQSSRTFTIDQKQSDQKSENVSSLHQIKKNIIQETQLQN